MAGGLLVAATFSVACGGGSDEDGGPAIEFSGEIEFEGGDEAGSFAVSEGGFVSEELRLDTQIQLVKQGFLLDWVSLIVAFENTAGRMERLASDDREKVDLLWVQQVHDLTQRSEILCLEGYRMNLPEDVADGYRPSHRRFLIAVESFGFASERLIDAALVMGPGGRLYDDLNSREQVVFDATRNQAVFYSEDCLLVLAEVKKDLEDRLEEIRFGEGRRRR